MLNIRIWSAIDQQGRGAIGVSEDDVVRALARSDRIAIAEISVWRLCSAIWRAKVVPLKFTHRWSFARTNGLRRAG